MQRAITLKGKITFLYNLTKLSTHKFYQLTKFEAACCKCFGDFFMRSFPWPNLQRAITHFFKKIHQFIYSLSSTSGPNSKTLAIIDFKIILITD